MTQLGVKQINNRISLNMTFTFTIRISQRFSSAREFQMGNFQKYWLQNVGQDFIVLDFFHGRKIFSWREGWKGPSKSGEKYFVGGRSCGMKRCVQEINVSCAGDPVHVGDKVLTRRLPCKGGGLTGMHQWCG
jgi:hypothetical protein